MTEVITDRKDQYEYNLMKCCILPTRPWFILSNESTKAAMHLAVLVPEVQSTDSMQPFGNSSNKSKSVAWHSTLHLTVSEYLMPFSRMYTALLHKCSQRKSSDMLHTVSSVWAGSNMHNTLRWMNITPFTYRKRQCLVSWIAPRTPLIALPRSPLSKGGV